MAGAAGAGARFGKSGTSTFLCLRSSGFFAGAGADFAAAAGAAVLAGAGAASAVFFAGFSSRMQMQKMTAPTVI